MCIVTATYSTRYHMVHTRVVDVFVHSDQWSLFTVAIAKKKYVYLSGRTY